ncbi:MAG: potassium channel protein [Dehalococcoidia bacterium]|nr:potassium channel protein [Dehalococcoidia bacterium]
MTLARRLLLAAAALLLLLGVGAAWYTLVEGYRALDGAYAAVIFLTTVGELADMQLDDSGKAFTAVYVLLGVGVMFYTAVTAVEGLIAGDIAAALAGRRSGWRVHKMRDHAIVCGFGRVGRAIAEDLQHHRIAVVVIDRDPDARAAAATQGFSAVLGDATEEDVLREAGVERARVLFAASDSDIGNTFVTLTARALNARLAIVSRAGSDSAEQRLRAAGANRVVSPYRIAGRRMAIAAVQPLVFDFVEAPGGPDPTRERLLTELLVANEAAPLAGRTLADAFGSLRETRVLAVERERGEQLAAPPATTELRPGDRLVLYGSRDEIEALSAPAAPPVRGASSAPVAP